MDIACLDHLLQIAADRLLCSEAEELDSGVIPVHDTVVAVGGDSRPGGILDDGWHIRKGNRGFDRRCPTAAYRHLVDVGRRTSAFAAAFLRLLPRSFGHCHLVPLTYRHQLQCFRHRGSP